MVAQVEAPAKAVEEAIGKLDVDLVAVAALAQWEGSRLAESARRLLPTAQSVVVVAMEVFPEVLALSSPTKVMGEGAARDIFAPHLAYLEGRLTKAVYDLAKAARRAGLRALPLPGSHCPLDARYQAAAFSFKHAAEAAGLGQIGKSSLLITPQFGPRVRLASLLTEAVLAPTSRTADNLCSDCQECLVSCPANALAEPAGEQVYNINKFACCAYRGGAGGCAECMKVCPAGA